MHFFYGLMPRAISPSTGLYRCSDCVSHDLISVAVTKELLHPGKQSHRFYMVCKLSICPCNRCLQNIGLQGERGLRAHRFGNCSNDLLAPSFVSSFGKTDIRTGLHGRVTPCFSCQKAKARKRKDVTLTWKQGHSLKGFICSQYCCLESKAFSVLATEGHSRSTLQCQA